MARSTVALDQCHCCRDAQHRLTAGVPSLLHYHPFYCEENIWWLCSEPPLGTRIHQVIFVASSFGVCPIAEQRAGGDAGLAWWDYHCVGLDLDRSIWDLDSRLPRPVSADRWLALSFPEPDRLPALLRPRFRVVASESYLAHFASDRRHMRTPTGDWLRAPPPWPCIGNGSNLARYCDVTDAAGPGQVFDLSGFADLLSLGSPGSLGSG